MAPKETATAAEMMLAKANQFIWESFQVGVRFR
jgi:hypothetical protein